MNATEVADELVHVRDDQERVRRNYDNECAGLVVYMKAVKDSCTHLREDGTSGILSGINGLYEYCIGCGTTF